MANLTILTKEGYEKLNAELREYVDVRRPDASEKIKIARDFGDLSENAEYDAAKEEQGRVEFRIKQLIEYLDNIEIIDMDTLSTDIVNVGAYVTVHEIDFDETSKYRIVGEIEADINQNLISNESPIAVALLGKKKGAKVTVATPQSTFDVKIISISKE